MRNKNIYSTDLLHSSHTYMKPNLASQDYQQGLENDI